MKQRLERILEVASMGSMQQKPAPRSTAVKAQSGLRCHEALQGIRKLNVDVLNNARSVGLSLRLPPNETPNRRACLDLQVPNKSPKGY